MSVKSKTNKVLPWQGICYIYLWQTVFSESEHDASSIVSKDLSLKYNLDRCGSLLQNSLSYVQRWRHSPRYEHQPDVFSCFELCVRRLSEPSGKWSDVVLAPVQTRPSSSDSRTHLHLSGWFHIWLAGHAHPSPDPHLGAASWQVAQTLGRCTSGWRTVWACQPAWDTNQQWKDVWHSPEVDLCRMCLYPWDCSKYHGWWCSTQSHRLRSSVWVSLWEQSACQPHSAICRGPLWSEEP